MENNEEIQKRMAKDKLAVIEEFRKTPIIQVACQKTGVGRASYYRWRKDDPEFAKLADEALKEGEELINDLSEAQIIALIKDQNWAAISFWLRHHHGKYRISVDINTRFAPAEELSPEQQTVVLEALKLTPLGKINANGSRPDQTNNTEG